jgi:hypothetical protein
MLQLLLSSPWGTEAVEVSGCDATGASLKQAVHVRFALAARRSTPRRAGALLSPLLPRARVRACSAPAARPQQAARWPSGFAAS